MKTERPAKGYTFVRTFAIVLETNSVQNVIPTVERMRLDLVQREEHNSLNSKSVALHLFDTLISETMIQ